MLEALGKVGEIAAKLPEAIQAIKDHTAALHKVAEEIAAVRKMLDEWHEKIKSLGDRSKHYTELFAAIFGGHKPGA